MPKINLMESISSGNIKLSLRVLIIVILKYLNKKIVSFLGAKSRQPIFVHFIFFYVWCVGQSTLKNGDAGNSDYHTMAMNKILHINHIFQL